MMATEVVQMLMLNVADMVMDHAQDVFDRLKRNQELLIRAGGSSASLVAGSALATLANYRSSLLGPEPSPEVRNTVAPTFPAEDDLGFSPPRRIGYHWR